MTYTTAPPLTPRRRPPVCLSVRSLLSQPGHHPPSARSPISSEGVPAAASYAGPGYLPVLGPALFLPGAGHFQDRDWPPLPSSLQGLAGCPPHSGWWRPAAAVSCFLPALSEVPQPPCTQPRALPALVTVLHQAPCPPWLWTPGPARSLPREASTPQCRLMLPQTSWGSLGPRWGWGCRASPSHLPSAASPVDSLPALSG